MIVTQDRGHLWFRCRARRCKTATQGTLLRSPHAGRADAFPRVYPALPAGWTAVCRPALGLVGDPKIGSVRGVLEEAEAHLGCCSPTGGLLVRCQRASQRSSETETETTEARLRPLGGGGEGGGCCNGVVVSGGELRLLERMRMCLVYGDARGISIENLFRYSGILL